MQQLNINELKPHPRNNEFFDDMTGDAWEAFKESIKTSGIIEPIVVTNDMIIVSGHQRVRAAKELGLSTVMVDIRKYENDDDALLSFLMSNIDKRERYCSESKKKHLIVEIVRIRSVQEKEIKKFRNNKIKNYRREIQDLKQDIVSLHNGECDICELELGDMLEVHHILPLQNGGNNSWTNISCLCPNCHTLIHKYISILENSKANANKCVEFAINRLNHSAYLKFFNMIEKYCHKKHKFAWDKLTWA